MLPVAPADFQGDLIDPTTGVRIYRLRPWWEGLFIPAPPAPVPVPAPVPTVTPTPTTRWTWNRHGFVRVPA